MGSPKWQHRHSFWIHLLPGTHQIYSYIWIFSLKNIWKLDELLPTIRDKRTTSRPIPGASAHCREGSHQAGASPGGERGWCHTSGTPTPGAVLKRQAPKMSGLEKQQGWHPRDLSAVGNWDSPLQGLAWGLTWPETQWKRQQFERSLDYMEGDSFANLKTLAGGGARVVKMPPGDRGAGKCYYYCPLNLTWCKLQAWMWHPPQPPSPTFLKQMEGSRQFRHYPDALLEPNRTGSCSTSLLPGKGGRMGTVAALYCSLAKVCARGQLWHSMTLPHAKTT